MTFDPVAVLAFWREAGMARWFNGGAAFDAACRDALLDAHLAAARRELEDWMDTADGALALVLLLDQIPRNVFRGSGHAFASDGLARLYAARALQAGHDAAFEPALRAFFYLPFEHSEDAADQQRSVELFRTLGDRTYLDYALAHQEAIARFGDEARRVMRVLDDVLADRTYVAGEAYSIADIAHFGWLWRRAFPGIELEETPHVKRWYDAMAERPAVIKAIAAVEGLVP